MKKYSLKADKRDLVGRKVKQLRAKHLIPATVYGNAVQSVSVVVPADAFTKTFVEAGETGLVELAIGTDIRPVLIHTVQKDTVHGQVLHVEFYQVNLKQKVKANVPLVISGDAPAVMQKTGVLLTLIDEVEVEALPTDLPENISVDVGKLTIVGDEVKVSDLSLPTGVTVLTDAVQPIVRVGELVSKEAEAQAAAEAAEAAAKAAESAAATPGEAPAEAAPATEAKPEAKEEKK